MKIAFVAFDFGEYCVRLASGIAQGADTKVLCFLPREEADPYSHLLSDSVDLHVFDKPRLRESIKQVKMVAQLDNPDSVAKMQQQRLIVPHTRIAETAKKEGFLNVLLTGSGDERLLAALQFTA